ncbi:MAG: cytochrome C oxidase subunit II, partial [Treponema sp.]|nr:cytochrome C oxidase subunit II [Treponema sp.]
LSVIYEDAKSSFSVNDFNDLAKKKKGRIGKIKEKTGEPVYEDIDKVWDEISFVKPAETEVERLNRTYLYEKDKIRQRIVIMRNKMKAMYDYQYPIERRVLEERLKFLEREYYKFDYMINPYHVQPGLFLDVDITSIKRKKTTLNAMANVLNEFLHGVSKGFQDAAFASFSRRRSTVREDINQSFASSDESPSRESSSGGSAYLDLINSGDGVSTEAAPKAIAAPKRGRKAGVAAKAGGGKRGRKPGSGRRGGGALREV